MGEVYLAEHKYIARQAAIKFLRKELTSSEEVFNRFFTEARAASLIEHPGIIEVQDCGVHTDGRAYMIMEFLNGESVRGYLERTGKMDKDREGALAISRQVADALGAAHAQGIVHRDLKPDNIFLHVPRGRPPSDPLVKVLDFGIAKLIGGSAAGTKTRTGNLLGTPLYMSPEQCRGSGQIDNRSDIYSLGCIMYELFCGTPPFVAEGLGDLIVAHVAQPPPEPPGVTPAMRGVLLACLTKDPNLRPQSMEQLGRMLTEAGAAETVRLKKVVTFSAAAAHGPTSGIASPVGIRSPAALAATTPPPVGSPPFAPPTGASGIRPQPTPITSPGKQAGAPGSTAAWAGGGPSETTLGRTAGEVVDLDAPARSGNGKLVIGGLAVGAAALIGFLVFGRGGDKKPAPEGAAAVAAPAPAPATPPPAPAPPAEAPTSRIALEGLPAGAAVALDGRPAELPLHLPRGGGKHHVTVTAAGFDPLELSLDGSKDQTVTVALKKAAAIADKPAEKPSGKPHHKSERKHGGFSGFSDL
jgi:serine/threonine-protein kinase